MDLTAARVIVIQVSKQADGSWDWTASVDGKAAASGEAQSPDDAVDQAETKLWPDAEQGEDEEAGEQSPDDERSEPAPGAVPTHQQMWDSEAKKRNDRASDLAKL